MAWSLTSKSFSDIVVSRDSTWIWIKNACPCPCTSPHALLGLGPAWAEHHWPQRRNNAWDKVSVSQSFFFFFFSLAYEDRIAFKGSLLSLAEANLNECWINFDRRSRGGGWERGDSWLLCHKAWMIGTIRGHKGRIKWNPQWDLETKTDVLNYKN